MRARLDNLDRCGSVAVDCSVHQAFIVAPLHVRLISIMPATNHAGFFRHVRDKASQALPGRREKCAVEVSMTVEHLVRFGALKFKVGGFEGVQLFAGKPPD